MPITGTDTSGLPARPGRGHGLIAGRRGPVIGPAGRRRSKSTAIPVRVLISAIASAPPHGGLGHLNNIGHVRTELTISGSLLFLLTAAVTNAACRERHQKPVPSRTLGQEMFSSSPAIPSTLPGGRPAPHTPCRIAGQVNDHRTGNDVKRQFIL